MDLQTLEGCICRKSAGVVVFYLCATPPPPPVRITLKMWHVLSGIGSNTPVTPFKVNLCLRHGGSTGEGMCAPPRFVASYCHFVAMRMQTWDSKKKEQFLKSSHQKILAIRGHSGTISGLFFVVLSFCRFVVVLTLHRFAIWDNLIEIVSS